MSDGVVHAGVPRRPKKRAQTTREKAFVIALVIAIVGGCGALVWMGVVLRAGTPPPVGDRSGELTDIETFSRVYPVGEEGWIAELPATWAGQPAQIRSACERALERLHASPSQTLTILGPDGLPVADCGAQ